MQAQAHARSLRLHAICHRNVSKRGGREKTQKMTMALAFNAYNACIRVRACVRVCVRCACVRACITQLPYNGCMPIEFFTIPYAVTPFVLKPNPCTSCSPTVVTLVIHLGKGAERHALHPQASCCAVSRVGACATTATTTAGHLLSTPSRCMQRPTTGQPPQLGARGQTGHGLQQLQGGQCRSSQLLC